MSVSKLTKLRGLLAKEPDVEHFEKLLKLFTGWKDTATLEVGMNYAKEHLESWDDSARVCDVSICWPDFPKGEPLPFVSLCRGVCFHSVKNMGIRLLHAIANQPAFSSIAHLDLAGHKVKDQGLEILMASPYLTALRSLDLRMAKIGDDGITALAQSPNAQHLEVLELEHSNVSDAGIAALAKSPYVKRLKVLGLMFANIYDGGALAIAHSGNFASLEELNLAYNHYSSNTELALGLSPHLSLSLKRKHMHSCPEALLKTELAKRNIDTKGMTHEQIVETLLRESCKEHGRDVDSSLVLLQQLLERGVESLPENRFSEEVFHLLGTWDDPDTYMEGYEAVEKMLHENEEREIFSLYTCWPTFPKQPPPEHFSLVQWLFVYHVEDAVKCLDAPDLSSIVSLDFQLNNLTDEDIARLADTETLTGLKELGFSSEYALTEDAARIFVSSKFLGQLELLSFSQVPIGNALAKALADAPQCRGLKALEIDTYCEIDDEGYLALGTSPYLCEGIRQQYLSKCTKKTLHQHAKKIGIKGLSKLKKEGVVQALLLPSKSLDSFK